MIKFRVILICVFYVSPLFAFAQNIFANGDFEEGAYRYDLGLFFLERDSSNNRVADFWIGTDIYDSVDTFNDSIPGGRGGLPTRNGNGDTISVDYIFSGSKCIGSNYSFLKFHNSQGTFENREYFTNFLDEMPSRDSIYCISCMTSSRSRPPISRSSYALPYLSAWFTSGYPENFRTSPKDIRQPSVGRVVNLYPIEFTYMEDTLGWQQIQGLYSPEEKARYATFGIFDTAAQYQGKVLKYAQDTSSGEFSSYNYFDAFEGFAIGRKPFLRENYLACEFSRDTLLYEPGMPYDLVLNGVQVVDSLFSLPAGGYEYEIISACGSIIDSLFVFPSEDSLSTLRVDQCASAGAIALNLLELYPGRSGVYWTETGLSDDIVIESDTILSASVTNSCNQLLNSTVSVDFIDPIEGREDTVSLLELDLPAQVDLTQYYGVDSLVVGFISVEESGVYQYLVLTACDTISAQIVVLVEPTITDTLNWFFPTGFSPNGDGINDTWEVFYTSISFEVSEVLIFNRSGEMVFEGTRDDSWDGVDLSTGDDHPSGAYAVIARYRPGPNALELYYEGSITIVR
ncbi:MAG: gliding motility-associated C-terminal domain-containing protein [Saprospiraceae bacterium]